MDTNIQSKKIELNKWLSTIYDVKIIDKLLKLCKAEQQDCWDETSEAERTSIAKGKEDSKAGKLNSHSEAKKLYEKWL